MYNFISSNDMRESRVGYGHQEGCLREHLDEMRVATRAWAAALLLRGKEAP